MLSLVLCLSASARYDPNWASLMSRPLPQWFDEAKIGLFIHWGVFSVPSFNVAPAPSEWYWWRIAGSKVPEWVAFHNKTYGPDFKYSEFLPKFTAELWQPGQWAELFKAAGVKCQRRLTKCQGDGGVISRLIAIPIHALCCSSSCHAQMWCSLRSISTASRTGALNCPSTGTLAMAGRVGISSVSSAQRYGRLDYEWVFIILY